MSKLTKPRAGSLGYSPRVRARRIYPKIKSWPESEETKPLAFAGYKAGMTHVMATDKHKNSPTYEQKIMVPATIIEVPPISIFGVRIYKSTPYGKKTMGEILAEKFDKNLTRKIKPPKKRKEFDEKLIEEASEVRLLVHTNPPFKKTPEIFEIKVGGDVKAAFDYAKSILGKQINARDVLREGDYVDVMAVTKGKGFQGPIKRWGIKVQYRKAHGKRRHIGALGPWHPAKTMWTVPQAGQMGFHTRTDPNKIILKIGENGNEITPKGGMPHYGVITGDYILIKGSVPGPRKRLIMIRPALRPPEKKPEIEIASISTSSKQGVRVQA